MSRSLRSISVLCLALCAVFAAAALAGCGGSAGPGASSSPSAGADPVVLRVNGRAVRQSAVDAVRAEFRLGGSRDTEARAEREAVRRELVRQEAERLGVSADPDEVEARRSTMAGQLGGEQALVAALKNVPMTDRQLRSDLRDGVLREAVQDAKFDSLSATRAKARTYYLAHRDSFYQPGSAHVWSIQVAAERIAESAIGRLRSGRPFAEVARQFSTDPEAKAEGGDMGVVALSSLPVPLRKAVESAKSGVATKPVQGPGGWYVLKATDVQPARTLSFAEAEQGIVKELTGRLRFQALEHWIDGARGEAAVTRP
jgi:parvulin-like peptidyl-prolyl isomerase